MQTIDFGTTFTRLTGNKPFPWQRTLFEDWFARGNIPSSCNIPTGLGKTSVVAIWLITLAKHPERMPRRLVYVVNRRTVVDQTTIELQRMRECLGDAGLIMPLRQLCAIPLQDGNPPLAISTLRGQFADNREWSSDPARPAVIAGTVDMIGSRLLFSGYGCGFKSRPLHAGFLGQDVLLVHDEAHLEPPFQELITAIEHEQRRGRTPDFRPLRVMELTATSRASSQSAFGISDDDLKDETVKQRMRAKKGLAFHEVPEEKKIADTVADLALARKDSGQAILIFLSSLDGVKRVEERLRKARQDPQLLTGTVRGYERDRLPDNPIFVRFLPESSRSPGVTPRDTVYLVCTSAGEVGVNLSGDQMVCDLTTFESMAQRLGRVNRFGAGDALIDVVHPKQLDTKDKPREAARERTLTLLQRLPLREDGRYNASPEALASLPMVDRLEAFSPQPITLPTSDILWDAWALTSIREPLPGRPVVEPYLHGIAEWEPPESYVAWRHEIGIVAGALLNQYTPEDLLEDYPLKPHELLRDRTDRVFKHLEQLAKEHADKPVWLMAADDSIQVMTLGELVKLGREELNWATVLLPPSAGGLTKAGMLGTSEPAEYLDVADEWRDEQGRRRIRLWDDELGPKDVKSMRLVCTIDTRPEVQIEETDEEIEGRRFWEWYVRPRSAEDGNGSSAPKEQLLAPHLCDAERVAAAFVDKLLADPGLQAAVRLAARWHDLGKRRTLWQRNMGNIGYPDKVIAKTGHNKPPKEWIDYRHEFGSLLDLRDKTQAFRTEFEAQPDDVRELILHLIAAHHGRGRPYFPSNEVFDPEPKGTSVREIAAEIPRRFARLQQKYGRWGLAWLESLVRAADAEASAHPSEVYRD